MAHAKHLSRSGRGRVSTAATTAALLGTMLFIAPGAATAAGGGYAYSGRAYGTSVNVGNLVTSGPSSVVGVGCTDEAGIHKTNTLATIDVSPIVTSGTINTSVDTSATATSQQSQSTSEVQNVSLLDGLITADAVRAVSTTSHDGSGFHSTGAGSTLVNLKIGLTTIGATPAPNTTVPLVGLGSVVLNEQTSKVTNKGASYSVNMIHVFITTQNLLGIPVGTDIVVAHAKSDLHGPTLAILDGRAYGTSANVGELVESGPTALVSMPCLGTKGILHGNDVLGVNLPGILTSGTVATTAEGSIRKTRADGETTATVEGLDLLDGLVTATVIKADAHASMSGGTLTFSDEGSTFADLQVAGHPEITADAARNTRIDLLGLGTLWLHRVIQGSNRIEVRMVELIITEPGNVLGLAVGTDVRVAVAEASVHPST
ncbi:MAG TPA: choice-of-anchor P family protein [Acidimicrobiales bacterium]|nr:choice-of-anchor P family protein [Acidimicrobiales bacterium]